MGKITLYRLFSDPVRFPWNWLGHDIPKVGPTHSYLCTILARWASDEERHFLAGRPSWVQLKKAASGGVGVSYQIVQYCAHLYDRRRSERRDVSTEVLVFLERCEPIRTFMQKEIDRRYHEA